MENALSIPTRPEWDAVSDFKFPGVKGSPFSYQIYAALFLASRGSRGVLALSMGGGKTLASILHFVLRRQSGPSRRMLVVCPSAVKWSWELEVRKWTDLKAVVVTDAKQDVTEGDVLIVSYEMAVRMRIRLYHAGFDTFTVDEAHYAKTVSTSRSKVVRQLASRIPAFVALSGTPILNRPVEIWNVLEAVEPKAWGSWGAFAIKYNGAAYDRFGKLELGEPTNLHELRARLRSCLLRYTKEEMLPFLPPKVQVTVPVVMTEAWLRKYKMAEEDFRNWLRSEGLGRKASYWSDEGRYARLERLSALRHTVARAKVKAAVETVSSIVESGEKAVVFSNYRDVLAEVERGLEGVRCVTLTGETPDADRGEAVRLFQEDAGVKVFLGGIKAAGAGITLTAASHVVFIDLAWVPGDHDQAQDRLHRPGQRADRIVVTTLLVPGTVDERISEVLSRKSEGIDAVIDGRSWRPGMSADDVLTNDFLG